MSHTFVICVLNTTIADTFEASNLLFFRVFCLHKISIYFSVHTQGRLLVNKLRNRTLQEDNKRCVCVYVRVCGCLCLCLRKYACVYIYLWHFQCVRGRKQGFELAWYKLHFCFQTLKFICPR
jgi:hypothetical protein